MHQFRFFEDRLRELQRIDRYRKLVPRVGRGVHLVEPDGREMINFGGNDYLGLAAERQTPPSPTGSTASALVCGWTSGHQQLAEEIACLESTEAAVLFPTGYAACSGTIATLANERNLILSDQLNHASLIDGCRLSSAERFVFPHRDCDAVETVLKLRRKEFNHVWIVTDGVFSMDGDTAPLPQLCDLADKYDAFVIVDEAHGTGVLGQSGSGLCEAVGVKDRVAVRIGTLSKALGSQGGFVAGPRVVTDFLINACRPLIYSTALAPAAVAAARSAIDVIAAEPQRRSHLGQLVEQVLAELDLSTNRCVPNVPIIPVPVGSDADAIGRSRLLAERGFLVPAIRPPTVPPGTARLRISLSAAHDEAMVAALVTALGEVMDS